MLKTFSFFWKKKRVIFAWKTSNITNRNDTESRKFHACTNCILQFWTKKRAKNGAKAPGKGPMEEWTHMSHFEFLVGTNTAKIRAAYFKLAKISCWVIRAKGTPILTKRQPSPQKRNKLGRMNKRTCPLFKFSKLATCLILPNYIDFLINNPC